jgi:hypothetical protein
MDKPVTSELFAGRINRSGGKIEDLSNGFSIPIVGNDFLPFSIFITPITSGTSANDISTIVNCKCYNNETAVDTPFTLNCWDVPLLKEISIDGIDLNNFNVYYGLGR